MTFTLPYCQCKWLKGWQRIMIKMNVANEDRRR